MEQAPIKRFKPRHDLVVMLHLRGRQNTEIAEALNLTPQRVYQILQDPKAQMMIEKFRKQIKDSFIQGVEEQLVDLGPAAVENIAKTINTNIPVGARAKKHQDDVSFKLLDRIGFTPKSKEDERDGSSARFDRDIQERIASALEQSRQIHAYDEAEEAEWIEIEGSDTVTSNNSTGSGGDVEADEGAAAPSTPQSLSSASSTEGGEPASSPSVLPLRNGDNA